MHLHLILEHIEGIPWRSNSYTQRFHSVAWLQPLLGELRPRKPHSLAKK